MPGQLFNLGRYFRRQKEETPASSPPSQREEVTTQSTVVSQTTTQAEGGPVSYSGIGPPPGGGQPYSGIGLSPSPPKTPPEVKTQTTTSAPGEAPPSSVPSTLDLGKRSGMDLLTRLTQRANNILMAAIGKARELKLPSADTEHVLWGLLNDAGVFRLLTELKVTPSQIQQELEKSFKPGNFSGQPQFSPRVKKVLELALSNARFLGFEFISPEHILLALAQEGEGQAAQILAKFGLTVKVLNQKVMGKKEVLEEESGKVSTLEQYGDDLTQKAREGKLDPVVERSQEIERVIHILSRRTKNNPCLIGDAGVGKTAIVEGLAQKIVKGDVPETLLNKRILSLDLMSLIAGARHRGEFEERLKNLIKEIKAQSGQIILFIDEIQNMVGAGAGSEGTMDASNILKPSLARGELQTIGTTTITEYRKYIEKDPALERRFQPVSVAEPTAEQASEMLHALRDKYEAFHRVKITEEAIEAAVRLSQRYIGDRFLPDKAVDLIDEAGSAVRLPAISLPEEIKGQQEKLARLENEKKEAQEFKDAVRLTTLEKEIQEEQEKLAELKVAYEAKKSITTNEVTPQIIAEIVSRWTNIPVTRLTQTESEKLLNLEEVIHQRIINQEEAVQAVAEAVRRGRAGLRTQKRPIGSFILMGPTGVGKTELAKALAEVLFGAEEMMVRLDMSEYMEKHEVAKLIGAPPGYVGYEEGGQLTEAVRRHPYAVVLLDEIEKAHPDVFNILIQILEDGRLTDNKGHLISFKNAIIICTSNIGTGLIQKENLKIEDFQLVKPTIFTYAVTPTGREIVTQKNKFFAKGHPEEFWQAGNLEDYFAGAIVTNDPSQRPPTEGFDIQVFTPEGSEIIIWGNRFWQRTSPVAKEWQTGTLGDFFAGQMVANAAPDKPEEQLPTQKIETLAFDPFGRQMVTFGGHFWEKEAGQKAWKVGLLKDYLGLPLEKITDHLFKPDGTEIIAQGDKFWQKTKEAPNFLEIKLAALFPRGKLQEEKGTKTKLLPFLAEESQKEEEEKKEKEQFLLLVQKLTAELKKFFRPELLNRFDEIIVFRALSARHMLQIVELQFKNLAKLLGEQNIGLFASSLAKEEIARQGYDPLYGARPLRRVIQRLIENPISSLLIKEEVKSGEMVFVDFKGEEFTFKVEHPLPSPVEISQETPVSEEVKPEVLGQEPKEEAPPPAKEAFPKTEELSSPPPPLSAYFGEEPVKPGETSPPSQPLSPPESAVVSSASASQT